MGHETLFLSPVRSKTKMKKKNPKKRIDLRPKPAVKEAEINQENKQTKVKAITATDPRRAPRREQASQNKATRAGGIDSYNKHRARNKPPSRPQPSTQQARKHPAEWAATTYNPNQQYKTGQGSRNRKQQTNSRTQS